MHLKLQSELLIDYMENFFGYGNLNSDFWFIGMEEGGGNSFDEIDSRLKYWVQRGQKPLEDIAQYHESIGMSYFFSKAPKNQPTWNKLIRIILAYNGIRTTLTNVKNFQSKDLARDDSNTCLLELFPLPSPDAKKWIYSKISDLRILSSRETYKKELLPTRAKSIQNYIDTFKPKLVVFYGSNAEYRGYWDKVIGENQFSSIELDNRKAYQYFDGKTLYMIVNHPVATGITNNYFHEAGSYAAKTLQGVE